MTDDNTKMINNTVIGKAPTCPIDYKANGRHEWIGADGKLYVWDEAELKWKPRT